MNHTLASWLQLFYGYMSLRGGTGAVVVVVGMWDGIAIRQIEM